MVFGGLAAVFILPALICPSLVGGSACQVDAVRGSYRSLQCQSHLESYVYDGFHIVTRHA